MPLPCNDDDVFAVMEPLHLMLNVLRHLKAFDMFQACQVKQGLLCPGGVR